MPVPTRHTSAKSKANLKRTAGPGRPKVTAEEKEIRRISKALVNDPTYRKTLVKQLRDGKLHPSVQVMLWYYAFGKPAETIETKAPVPIRIVNEFT